MQLQKLKEALLGAYQVRKTAAQKDAFIQWLKGYAEEMGVPLSIEESGKLVRTRNLVMGDLGKARVLLTAHYDTCARLPVPNLMTPAYWPGIIFTQGILPFVMIVPVALLIGFAFGFGLKALNVPPAVSGMISSFVMMLLAFGVMWRMMAGPANPHTANDNTSGVAAVLLAMQELSGREDIAFVLFDHEELGLLGSSAFVKAHKQLASRVFVVNLDCVSDGDTMLLAGSKAAFAQMEGKRLSAALQEVAPRYGMRTLEGTHPKVLYPSDQLAFKKGMAFAALKGKKILYLDKIHTVRDTVFEDRNILCLMDVLKKAL